jgi:hypothetical protein
MQESHRKGLANHPDPESCVVRREAAIEALTGAQAGRVLSCEISHVQSADGVPIPEGSISRGVIASCGRTLRSRRPRHVWILHAREPGELRGVRRTLGGPGGEGR